MMTNVGLQGVRECLRDECRGMWRVMSEENRKCPRCNSDSDTREDEEGKLMCGEDNDDKCWFAGYEVKWRVVREDVGGTCPQCQTEWWKTGEKNTCRCPECGKMARSECVC